MSRKIWVSIDGGGTKTEICACDSNGKNIYDNFFGRSNYKTAGLDETTNTLKFAFYNMLESLQCNLDDIQGVVLASAGCDTEQDKTIYESIMCEIGMPKNRVLICNDTEVVFRALSDQDGICVVAGTGSIVCAYNQEALMDRVGGWGAPLSDLGSGYWIGSKILKHMLCWLEGIDVEEYAVYQEIAQRYSQEGVNLAWILSGLSVTEIASVSILAFQFAEQGDLLCRKVIAQAADIIKRQIVTLCKKVHFKNTFTIVAVGGLFSDHQFYEKVSTGVSKELNQELVFLRPIDSPAEDGLKYARKIFG